METIGAHYSAIIESRKNPLPGNYAYESARSCLYSLLRARSVKRVHIPNYICEAIPNTILDNGIEVVRYPISEKYIVEGIREIGPDDLIMLVNYFGLNERAILQQLEILPAHSVIADCSQAYFQEPFTCLANIYSARKYIPVPDGGFIHTKCLLETEGSDEAASIDRFRYLINRVSIEPEMSREQFLRAEQSLASPSLRKMSEFTRKFIETCDLDYIVDRRRENFATLQALSTINMLSFHVGGQVPLCYPLMVEDGGALRQKLKENRIFTPTYWPNVVPMTAFEKRLLEDTVYIPIDHRYGNDHMQYIIDTVMSSI